MKKNLMFAMFGAIALTGAVGLTSCSSSDDVAADVNPTYDPATNTVNTQFVMNIAAADLQGNTTRSSATATQATGTNFRGIEDVRILTYSQSANGKHLYDVSSDALATATRNYDLSELLSAGDISISNSRRVIELSLPVGTNTLMFYGKAPKPTLGDPSNYGNISFTVEDNANNSAFSSIARITGNETHYTATCNMLAAIMTRISNIGLHEETSTDNYQSKENRDFRLIYWTPGLLDVPKKTVSGSVTDLSGDELTTALAAGTYTDVDGGVTYTMHTVTNKDWQDYGDQYNNDKTVMKPLEEILGSAYNQLTNIRTVGTSPNTVTETRSGSGKGIINVIHDLLLVINKVADANPTNEAEFVAKKLGQRIRNRIQNYFVENGSAFKTLTELKSQVNTYIRDVNVTDAVDPTNFPSSLHVPDGAAQLTFSASANNNTGAFSYVGDITIFKPTTSAMTTTVEKFLYPAELVYFGNSPVRVSNETHETNNYPQTVANWDNDGYWVATNNLKGWTKDSQVSSTTRSVAMQRDINYGTALLATTVKYAVATLNDNQAACTSETADQNITVNESSFKLTGVIVGGQCQTVGWNFLKKDVSGNDYNFMVYDNYIGDEGTGITIPTTGTSDYNYTLLWDNYDAANNKQPVYVALEFVNNSGVDFWGDANLIRQGSKFYIVGKLDPTSKNYPLRQNSTTNTNNYEMPPYKADDGKTDPSQIRVFMQDYKTLANFSITASSLKKAYSTIPDLRSSQVSLGLSVDIQWESGLSFDVNLGQ